MPKAQEVRRGGVVRYRTIVRGRGRHKRVLRVSVLRKPGPRGGRTVAGPARKIKGK